MTESKHGTDVPMQAVALCFGVGISFPTSPIVFKATTENINVTTSEPIKVIWIILTSFLFPSLLSQEDTYSEKPTETISGHILIIGIP